MVTIDKDGFVIRPLVSDEWKILRDFRLHALQTEPGVFSSNFNKEKQYSEDEWKNWLTPTNRCTFGLFNSKEIVGITGIITSQEHPESAILIASYIKQEFRGQKLSYLFYKARLSWASERPELKKILVSHRESNEASRRANQTFGFHPTTRQTKTWPDGKTEDQIFYELPTSEIAKILSRVP